MASIQASIQSVIKPATWIPGIRNFHSEVHEWNFNVGVDEAMDTIWAAAKALDGYVPRKFNKAGRTMVVDFLTKAKWLDQIKISFVSSSNGGCVARLFNCSTGFLPCIIPLAPLINIPLTILPFGDGGKCAAAMQTLRKKGEETTPIGLKVIRKSITNPKMAKQTDLSNGLQS